MKNINRIMAVVMILALFSLWACEKNHNDHESEHPSKLVEIEGSDLTMIILTQKAIERIGLQTAMVTEMHHSPVRLIVPYSSILYDAQGQVWVYTSPKPFTFVRHKVEVDFIEGDFVYLLEGPPVGTKIVTVGATEVYGAEFEVGH